MKGLTDGAFSIFERLMNLAIWNIIWVGHTLMGFIIFGWAPATAALFSVLRDEKLKQRNDRKLKTFFYYYKQHFFKANVIGFLLIGGGLSIMFTFYTLIDMTFWIRLLLGTVLFVVFILYLIVAFFIFPVFTHFHTDLNLHIRYALMIGLAYLPQTFLIAMTLALTGIAYQLFPGIMLFYLASAPAGMVLAISLHVFQSIEEKAPPVSLKYHEA
ncbi:DUF624 domain-containing protein [Paenalkalicoccus suaedae]|uniref:DUF624 domain-containing protein n=1 Tax=Paenalkalicoccus suaedae TaxID=2592382 RepID=A0A859FAE3_9BACI|nr:DUF624 domain-containing protein [Paenalkalicoccus suaedae]QKS69732.1 DUF624 domain-containing protein [Paenalkalicoccus suaedae]